MKREEKAARRKARDKRLSQSFELRASLVGLGVMVMFMGGESLLARSYVRLECTRGKDCFLIQANWLTEEVMHFREHELRGAEVGQQHTGKRNTPVDNSYRPYVRVDTFPYPLWYVWSSRQDAEEVVARVTAWKAATDSAPLRIEDDQRAFMARKAAPIFATGLVMTVVGLILVVRLVRASRPPKSLPRFRERSGKRGR